MSPDGDLRARALAMLHGNETQRADILSGDALWVTDRCFVCDSPRPDDVGLCRRCVTALRSVRHDVTEVGVA